MVDNGVLSTAANNSKMIHQLVIILLLSQSTSSTARHAMEDLRIIAANALVKNIGRAYASLNDVVTPSIVEHVSARVLETTASSIQAAITRIAAQQQSFQEVTETRLAVLRSNIDGFFKSIPESNNTHIQNASVSPCVGVELDKLTPTRLSPSFSSAPEQSLQICSQVNKYDIPEQFCAARRTLGFFPVALKQSQFPSGLTNVTEDLQKYLIIFMKDYLQMDSSKIEQLIIEDIWYNSTKSMLFAQFSSFDMCHSIFTSMHNLHGLGRVEKYIHPSLRSVYQGLQEKAFSLRHAKDLQTRIDYSSKGLSLLFKKKGDTRWTMDSEPLNKPFEPNVNLTPLAQNTSLSPILQVDGNASLDSVNSQRSCEAISLRTRVANFELNQVKQIAGICQDAKALDYSVTYNDSNKKVNIDCTSGFYAQVAKPTLCSLA